MLASLKHPNIATIHGVEESGGIRALVLELVDGETLAERIARGVHARWNQNGRELVFWSEPGGLTSVALELSSSGVTLGMALLARQRQSSSTGRRS